VGKNGVGNGDKGTKEEKDRFQSDEEIQNFRQERYGDEEKAQSRSEEEIQTYCEGKTGSQENPQAGARAFSGQGC
jgi:hypothetical protein